MRKYDLRFARWVGIAWIVLATLVGCVAPAAEETTTVQPVTAIVTMVAVTPSPTATLSPTLSPTATTETTTSDSPIPLCTFVTDAVPGATEASLDDYVFSAPWELLIRPSEIIEIIRWLPDSQRLLMTRASRDSPGVRRQTIEVFNVLSSETHIYAERNDNGTYPIWLPEQQAVVYLDKEFVDEPMGKVHYNLWISRGNREQVQQIAQDIWSLSIDTDDRLTFFERADDQLQVLDVKTDDQWSLPLEPFSWMYSPEITRPEFTLAQSNRTWQPNGSLLLLYSQLWTFLLDTETNQICAIDLGVHPERGPIRALRAEWSPNGRYLALETTSIVSSNLAHFSELTILDIETESHFTLQPAPDISPGQGQRYVGDIAWAPDSRHLTIWGYVFVNQVGLKGQGLYLVDVTNNEYQRLFPALEFSGGRTLLWSPDGSLLVVSCPNKGLCLVSVEAKR